MSRTTLLLMAHAAVLCSVSFADSLDIGVQQAAPAAVPLAAPALPPVALGRHHIAVSWFGFSKAGSDLKQSYLDATAGEGGFFQYRYSFTRHVDAVVDCRAWINDVEDDSIVYNIESQVGGVGFGVRYTFDGFKLSYPWVFPYLQASVLQADATIESQSGTRTFYTDPGVFWTRKGAGWGFALSGGADIRLGKLISIPVDIAYFHARPRLRYEGWTETGTMAYWPYHYLERDLRRERFNVSSLMLSAGIGFNWGRVQ